MKTSTLPPINLDSSKELSSLNDLLTQLQIFSFQRKWTFIIYRLPIDQNRSNLNLTVIISTSKLQKKKFSLLRSFTPHYPIFTFHPFDIKKNHSCCFFSSNIIYQPLEGSFSFDSNSRTHAQELKKIILENLSTFPDKTSEKSQFSYPQQPSYLPDIVSSSNLTTAKTNFKKNLKSAIQTIKSNDHNLEKIVLTKTKVFRKKNSSHRLITCLTRILDQYPNSFLSLVIGHQVGCWIGISPELLVKKNKKNIFNTVSLAGTQILQPSQKISDITWGQKEIEEQAFVGRHIVDCFKKIRLREYQEIGPSTFQSGNLAHLMSEFTVDLNQHYGANLPYEMLHLLHPTSAICGTPKTSAFNLIHLLEEHKRKFYTGFLGPVGWNDEIHIYVNLRCAEIGPKEICLYSGAGITLQSNIKKEWIETENKLKTIKNVLMLQ